MRKLDCRTDIRLRISSTMLVLASFSLSAALALTDEGLTNLVNKSHVVAYPVRAQHVGSTEAAFSAYRSATASDKDCKIDAVLIAKTIMASEPKIVGIQGNFYQPGSQYHATIEIHAGDVIGFAKGGLKASELLSSLTLKQSLPANQYTADLPTIIHYSVKDGFEKVNRTEAWTAIVQMTESGGDTSSLWKQFMDIENELDSAENAKLVSDFNRLSASISRAQSGAAIQNHNVLGHSDIRALPGYALRRRTRIALTINKRVVAGEDVYSLRQKYKVVEDEARLNQKSDADKDMVRLEDDLGLSHMASE